MSPDLKRGALAAIQKGYESRDLETLLRSCDDALALTDTAMADDIRSDVRTFARGALFGGVCSFPKNGHVSLDAYFDPVFVEALQHFGDAYRRVLSDASLDAVAQLWVRASEMFRIAREKNMAAFPVDYLRKGFMQVGDAGIHALKSVEHPFSVYPKIVSALRCVASLTPHDVVTQRREELMDAFAQIRSSFVDDYTILLDFLVMKAKNPQLVNTKLHESYKHTNPDDWPERLQRLRAGLVRYYRDVTIEKDPEQTQAYDSRVQMTLFDTYPGTGDSAWHATNLFYALRQYVSVQQYVTKDFVEVMYGRDREKLIGDLHDLKARLRDELHPRLCEVCADECTAPESVLIESYLLAFANVFGLNHSESRTRHENKLDALLANMTQYGFSRDFAEEDARVVVENYVPNVQVGEGETAGHLVNPDEIVGFFESKLREPDIFLRGFYDA